MRAIEIKIIAFICLLCFCGCSDKDEPQLSDYREWTEHTVAVVLPMENGLDSHWKRTLGMFATNFERAFKNQDKGIKLNFEYYDESTTDIPKLAEDLAFRDDIYAVIGGLYSSNAQELSSGLTPAGKHISLWQLQNSSSGHTPLPAIYGL